MANDADETVIAANGRVLVAPVGTAAPADVTAAFSGTWVELGYINDDGVNPSFGKTILAVMAWQSQNPIRRKITGRDETLAFTMKQWNKFNLIFAFGGGAVTVVSAGEYRYAPPDPEDLDERALAIEWEDGTKKYRLIVVRGMVSDNVQTQLQRGAESGLPVTFGINGADSGDNWYLLTNDPAFA